MPRKATIKTPAYPEDFIGPQEPHFLTLLPFPGFYSSILDGDIDSHAEQEAEHYSNKEEGGYQGTEYPDLIQPEHARITQEEFSKLFFDAMDYGTLHRLLAHCYADAFNHKAEDTLGFPIGMKFESMDSPAYYNFETDRLFVHIPMRTARQIVRQTLRTKTARDTLRNHISARHSSRSGFHSWYRTDSSEWAKRAHDFIKGRDSGDMDHNHFQTFLEAAIMHAYSPTPTPTKRDGRLSDFENEVYETYSQDGIYQEWEQAMDWTKFDAACVELRQEKNGAWQEENPGEPLPPQPCPDTPDMLKGAT